MTELPKIVRQRLHATQTARVHPDPDLVTAFLENSLADRERVQVLEHFSRCAGCRELVTLSASQTDANGKVAQVHGDAGWLSWRVLRWGAAVACVVVVGAAITLRHNQENTRIGRAVAERNSQPEPAAHNNASVQFANHDAKTPPLSKQAEQRSQPRANNEATLAAGERMPVAASRDYAAASPVPVEMADAKTGLTEAVPGRAKVAVAEPQDTREEKAVGAFKKKRNMATGGAIVTTDELTPASLSPRWTLSSDGTLQRSVDSGRTWQTIPVAGKTLFRALAANGLDIWVGGSAGTLFHSSDAGEHWVQVRPVGAGEVLSDDVIGVEFTDLLHGKVTTSGGESWVTVDAGQTWQRQ